ncbi:MAG: type secretion system-associated immunity protein, partial [Myxococcaceae bacterium]|nr:type secretion system-associated immunity protein [Myxococcaceae bacterium]
VLGCTIVSNDVDASPVRNAKPAEIEQAREYVLAACLADKYPESPLAAEAEVWAGGLVERGTLKGQVYPELAQLARTLAPAVQASQSGVPMLMKSCVALYNSPVLRRTIVRLLSR